ncbi:cytochrome b [Simiduia curdlanivorans]|uniref:Cytochrome b n=1 Tax=Simiduia curdlanivorans TaxID=1492769 RepID=A0ABV8VAA5_9GAMM|nr:cytochrome b [Simiduia curdlanivorans]MDN3639537.1 cytochrome b [Simiduia curdlanivorans]
MSTSTTYHRFSKLLHWLMAIMVFVLIGVGSYMSDLADDAPGRMDLILLHKASGFIFLWLVMIRLIWSKLTPAPALPSAFNSTEIKLTKATKHLLYLAMFLVPFSGWAMSNFSGYAVKFGNFSVPLVFEKSKSLAGIFHEIHEIAPWVLLALVAIHLAAVIYHKLEGGDKDILKRML